MADLSEANQMGVHDWLEAPRFAARWVVEKAALTAGHKRFVISREFRVHMCAAVFVGSRWFFDRLKVFLL